MVSALAALKNLATNEDSVKQIVQLGGLELTVDALKQHIDNPVSRKSGDSHLAFICSIPKGR